VKLYKLIIKRKRVFSQSDGQGLLLCWHLCSSSPEPLLIEKLKMKLTTKSQIEFRRLDMG
jgi:hypothetical protein